MRAWRGLLAATARLVSRLDADLQEVQRLSVADYGVLATLSEVPEARLRMTELAERMALSPSGLTRRVDSLVRAGLVQRVQCPEDRRGTFAALTAEGRHRLQAAAPDHVAQVRRHLLDRLDRAQLRALADIADAILAGLMPTTVRSGVS